jgi:hypothetical protein
VTRIADERRPCDNCGRVIDTGEAKILVPLTVGHLAELATACPSADTRRRLLCALELLDAELADSIRRDFKAYDRDWHAARAAVPEEVEDQ